MSKRRLSSIVLAALFPFGALVHSVAANADTLDDIKSRGTMTVAIDPTFAPYEYTDASNNIHGFTWKATASTTCRPSSATGCATAPSASSSSSTTCCPS